VGKQQVRLGGRRKNLQGGHHLDDAVRSSPWHPESKIIIDIPTALSFFLDHREHTKKKVAKMAQKLVDAWNEAYAGTKNVIFSLLFFQ